MPSGHGNPLSLDSFAQLAAAATKALPRDMSQVAAHGWANAGEALTNKLRSALLPPKRLFEYLVPWKSLRRGRFKNADELREAYAKTTCWLKDDADEMLDSVNFKHRSSEEVDLVMIDIEEAGFLAYEEPGRTAVLEKLRSLGFAPCPDDLAPEIPLHPKNPSWHGEVVIWTDLCPSIKREKNERFAFAAQSLDGKQELSAQPVSWDWMYRAGNRIICSAPYLARGK